LTHTFDLVTLDAPVTCWGPSRTRWRSAAVIVVLIAFFLGASPASAQVLPFARDDYASETGARAIASADFNRDGIPDLAVANADNNSISILLGRGNGFVRTSRHPSAVAESARPAGDDPAVQPFSCIGHIGPTRHEAGGSPVTKNTKSRTHRAESRLRDRTAGV
jgi:hypothetical protein